ncbi:MAG: inositol monophosphatase family protein [Bdellovibrionota bacterium]
MHKLDPLFDTLKDIIGTCIDQTKDIACADVRVSNVIKDFFATHPVYQTFAFFSEEDQSQAFTLPMILLDPIDGTKEFIKGSDECVVSMSILYSLDLHDQRNMHWIYNFRNQDEVLYNNRSFTVQHITSVPMQQTKYQTVISRTEYKKYELARLDILKLYMQPIGSIAYKLAALATQACDFVISIHNKHVWDIAAGSMMLSLQDYVF